MMFAWDGEGAWKSGCSEGDCMNFINQFQMRTRGGVKEPQIIVDIVYGSPLSPHHWLVEWFFGFPPSSVVVLRVAELGVITSNWRERQEIWIYCGPACFAHLSYGGGKKNPKTVLISFQGMMGKYMNAVYPKRNYPVIGSSSLVDFLHTVHVVSHFCWKLLQAVWALTTVLSFWIRTGNGIIMTTVC